jgi:hypothetical protein
MNVADKNAIRARIALIATERGLPESEIKKAMGGYWLATCCALRGNTASTWTG